MTRREFLMLASGMAVAGPHASRAQQPTMPVVGLLGGVAPEGYALYLAGFYQGLKEAGFVEGQNVLIEQRWVRGQLDKLSGIAAEFIGLPVNVLVTLGGTSVALAAKAATITIPVVFALGSDPVEDGLVASFNRPGGNITGVTFFTNQLIAKRLELLREIVPKPAMVSVFVNPKNANAKRDIRDIEAAARSLGQPVEILRAGTPDEIDLAFASFPGDGSGALLVTADAFFSTRREQFALLSARYSVPAIFGQREFVTAGGLASYGSNVADSHRQAGIYVGRILKGVKPTDLPVMQPTRFNLAINLRTAKALGLNVPPTLLARADEVIE